MAEQSQMILDASKRVSHNDLSIRTRGAEYRTTRSLRDAEFELDEHESFTAAGKGVFEVQQMAKATSPILCRSSTTACLSSNIGDNLTSPSCSFSLIRLVDISYSEYAGIMEEMDKRARVNAEDERRMQRDEREVREEEQGAQVEHETDAGKDDEVHHDQQQSWRQAKSYQSDQGKDSGETRLSQLCPKTAAWHWHSRQRACRVQPARCMCC